MREGVVAACPALCNVGVTFGHSQDFVVEQKNIDVVFKTKISPSIGRRKVSLLSYNEWQRVGNLQDQLCNEMVTAQCNSPSVPISRRRTRESGD